MIDAALTAAVIEAETVNVKNTVLAVDHPHADALAPAPHQDVGRGLDVLPHGEMPHGAGELRLVLSISIDTYLQPAIAVNHPVVECDLLTVIKEADLVTLTGICQAPKEKSRGMQKLLQRSRQPQQSRQK